METFRDNTASKINGKAKMMVVTASRPAAVLYFREIKRYAEEQGYTDIKPMAAFSGEVILDGDEDYQEWTGYSDVNSELFDNYRLLGKPIREKV